MRARAEKAAPREPRRRARRAVVAWGSVLQNNGYSRRALDSLAAMAARNQADPEALPLLLISFEYPRTFLSRNKKRGVAARLRAQGVRAIFLPRFPERLRLIWYVNVVWSAALLVALALRFRVRVFHAHSHHAATGAVLAARLTGGRAIFDVHGVDVEERILVGKYREGSSAHRADLAIQRFVLDRSDGVIAVSAPLVEYLDRAGRRPETPVLVVPSCTDLRVDAERWEETRRVIRAERGYGDRAVVLYAGSAAAWQWPERVATIAARLHERTPGVLFLLLTPDGERFRGLFRAAGVPDDALEVREVPHDEIPRIAPAADVALLLRQDHLVNRVASPCKFAEYLACGLPVAVTRSLEECARIVREEDLGIVVDGGASDDAIAADLADYLAAAKDATAIARRAIAVASSRFQWESAGRDLARFHRSVMNPRRPAVAPPPRWSAIPSRPTSAPPVLSSWQTAGPGRGESDYPRSAPWDHLRR